MITNFSNWITDCTIHTFQEVAIAFLVAERSPMRENQRMNGEELRAVVKAAVAASNKTQYELADELNVTQSAISRAVNEAASNLAGLQGRIIEHLTDYRIEPEKRIAYVVRKKSSSTGR